MSQKLREELNAYAKTHPTRARGDALFPTQKNARRGFTSNTCAQHFQQTLMQTEYESLRTAQPLRLIKLPGCLHQKVLRTEYRQPNSTVKGEQIFVAANNHGSLTDNGQHQKLFIRWVPALRYSRRFLRLGFGAYNFAKGQVICEQGFLLARTQLEFWVGKCLNKLFDRRLRNEWSEFPRLPVRSEFGEPAGLKHQGRNHHIGIQDKAQATRVVGQGQSQRVLASGGRRAQATAVETSCSVIPSSASFFRTASAFCRRTGVRTIRPSATSTSRYSNGPNDSVRRLGRVTWFLGDSFASISLLSENQKVKNNEESVPGQEPRSPGPGRLRRSTAYPFGLISAQTCRGGGFAARATSELHAIAGGN